GVSLRTAQAAMRHSTPDLTANVYTDPRLLDVAGALDALPALPLDGASRQAVKATGTAGKCVSALAPLLAPPIGFSSQIQTTPDKAADSGRVDDFRSLLAATSNAVKQNNPPSIADSGLPQSRLRDLNPGPQLYESCALPLS